MEADVLGYYCRSLLAILQGLENIQVTLAPRLWVIACRGGLVSDLDGD